MGTIYQGFSKLLGSEFRVVESREEMLEFQQAGEAVYVIEEIGILKGQPALLHDIHLLKQVFAEYGLIIDA